MKKSQKPEPRELTSNEALVPEQKTSRITLRIEELEPRLTPQSSTSILD
jgi:hypothetical protein